VDVELALAEYAWEWTNQRCPGEPRVAEQAVAVALTSFVGGASVVEAYEQVRAFVNSRVDHPAGQGEQGGAQLPLAS
jgi:hypothetical protein